MTPPVRIFAAAPMRLERRGDRVEVADSAHSTYTSIPNRTRPDAFPGFGTESRLALHRINFQVPSPMSR